MFDPVTVSVEVPAAVAAGSFTPISARVTSKPVLDRAERARGEGVADTRRGRHRPARGVDWRVEFPMADLTRITADPAVMMGKPIIRGTRLTVEHILDELAEGLAIDELVASHPRLTREDIQAALAFAAESVRMERLGAVQQAS